MPISNAFNVLFNGVSPDPLLFPQSNLIDGFGTFTLRLKRKRLKAGLVRADEKLTAFGTRISDSPGIWRISADELAATIL